MFFLAMLNPLVILLILLGLSLLFLLIKRKASSIVFIVLSLVWLLLIGVSPLPQWLILNLEKATTPVNLAQLETGTETHILILGSGHSISPRLPPTGQLSSTALVRLIEGIRIYKQLPNSKLVCSGYSNSGRTTQAEMLARAAIDLDVSPSDTLLMTRPSDTSEEVSDYAARFGNGRQLILVTSASHMPRALEYFHRRGLKPVPAPTDYYFKADPDRSSFNFKPSATKIRMMELALHEYGGLLELRFADDDL